MENPNERAPQATRNVNSTERLRVWTVMGGSSLMTAETEAAVGSGISESDEDVITDIVESLLISLGS